MGCLWDTDREPISIPLSEDSELLCSSSKEVFVLISGGTNFGRSETSVRTEVFAT
jgi:hypothetical protein